MHLNAFLKFALPRCAVIYNTVVPCGGCFHLFVFLFRCYVVRTRMVPFIFVMRGGFALSFMVNLDHCLPDVVPVSVKVFWDGLVPEPCALRDKGHLLANCPINVVFLSNLLVSWAYPVEVDLVGLYVLMTVCACFAVFVGSNIRVAGTGKDLA